MYYLLLLNVDPSFVVRNEWMQAAESPRCGARATRNVAIVAAGSSCRLVNMPT